MSVDVRCVWDAGALQRRRFRRRANRDRVLRDVVVIAMEPLSLVSLPGVSTPSEAFAALQAGATALKLFPAEASSPAALKALRAVLPQGTRILPVGGLTPDKLSEWHGAGAAGVRTWRRSLPA